MSAYLDDTDRDRVTGGLARLWGRAGSAVLWQKGSRSCRRTGRSRKLSSTFAGSVVLWEGAGCMSVTSGIATPIGPLRTSYPHPRCNSSNSVFCKGRRDWEWRSSAEEVGPGVEE
ncbi:unnamed protein product [Calypogeia fissa]